jgi:hypothetical protein
MMNRFKLATIPLLTIVMLAACSSKPPRPSIAKGGWTPQSSSQNRHYPLYTDDGWETGRRSYSQEFPRPPEIEPQVAFWRKVYSKWGKSQVAIHDKVHMGIIYDVFDVPGGDADTFSAWQKDYIQQRLTDWKIRLSALEDKVSSGMALDSDERELVQHITEKTGHRNAIHGASERLRHQRGMKERFMRGLEIGRRYDDQFRHIFRNAGLPEDLAYLPHVESSFQYNAHSSAGALGIWQFTSGAAKMFMNGNSSAAARLDPINSTHGAARYLAYAYDKLGSWPLAVTSYNHGIGGMQRAKNVHGHDFVSIVKHYNGPAFGFASRNYYAEFLAARDIASDPSRYLSDTSDNEHYVALSNTQPVDKTPVAAPAPEPEPQEIATPETSSETMPSEPTLIALEEPATAKIKPARYTPRPSQPNYQAEAIAAIPTSVAEATPETSSTTVLPEPTLAEPTLIALEEPVTAKIKPARYIPTPSQPNYQAESIAAIPAPVAAVFQPEPVPAVAELSNTESSEAEDLEASDEEASRVIPAKSTKVAANAHRKPEKQAIPFEPKKTPETTTVTDPKKPTLVKPPVDSKKPNKALVFTDTNKASKVVEAPTNTKTAAKSLHPTEPKLASKTSTAITASKPQAKVMASAKTIQPTHVKLSQESKQKSSATKPEAKKGAEKINIAKR